jgi:hypothetical protein
LSSPVTAAFADGKGDIELALQTGTTGCVKIASLVVSVSGTLR